MIPKSLPSGFDPRVDTGFRKKIMLQQKAGAGWQFEESHLAPAAPGQPSAEHALRAAIWRTN